MIAFNYMMAFLNNRSEYFFGIIPRRPIFLIFTFNLCMNSFKNFVACGVLFFFFFSFFFFGTFFVHCVNLFFALTFMFWLFPIFFELVGFWNMTLGINKKISVLSYRPKSRHQYNFRLWSHFRSNIKISSWKIFLLTKTLTLSWKVSSFIAAK